MNDAIAKLTGWISKLTDLLISLVVLGVIVGILFNDPFGVIAGVGNLFSQIGDNVSFSISRAKVRSIWYIINSRTS